MTQTVGTAIQITLKWMLQQNINTIPKSANKQRIQQNGDLFDFTLTDTEMAQIAQLDTGQRVGPDPNNFNF